MEDLSTPQLSGDDARHLATVRRLRSGEIVVASDGRGRWRPCRVVLAAGEAAAGRRQRERTAGLELIPDGPVVTEPEELPRITVAFSLVKGDRTDWAVAKLVELGADEIVPMICERTVVRPGDGSAGHRPGRLERIAREAAMQARRVRLPQVSEPRPLTAIVESAGALACLAEPGGAPPSLERPVVLVGPEGGWSPGEIELATSQQLGRITLATHVLRVETAAVAAGTILGALRAGLTSPAVGREPSEHS